MTKTLAKQTLTKLSPGPGNAVKLPGEVVERGRQSGHETLLRVEGLAAPAEGGPGLYSIIDASTGTELGVIVHLAKHSKDTHAHAKANLTLDISTKIAALAKSDKGVQLAVVTNRRGLAAPAAIPLTFRAVSVLER